MRYYIELLDICYPDYFQGHSNWAFAVPVSKETTFKDILDGIENDWPHDFSEAGFTDIQLESAIDDFKQQYVMDSTIGDFGLESPENSESYIYLTVLSE